MAREQVLLHNLKPKHLRSQNVPVKNEHSRFNKLFVMWLCVCWLVIGPWALRENNGLELAKQSTHYISYIASHIMIDVVDGL